MRRLVTAVAAIALIAGTAHAQGNGKGGGQGGDRGGGHDAGASMQGGGGGNGRGKGNAERGGGKADRGGGNQAAGAPREGGGSKDRGNAGNQGGGQQRAERGNSDNRGGERGNGNARAAFDNRGQGNAGRGNGNAGKGRGHDVRTVVIDDRGRGRDFVGGDVVRVRNLAAIPVHGLVAGCPPGLAKKNPPCIPPGQVRSPFRGYDRPDFWGLRLDGGRYWYDDGYLVRLGSNGRIGSYIPLLGGALAIGNPWPTYYQPVVLPTYYENYYGLGPYDSYRYADNVIYRIDPETAAITSVAALLTGDDFVVGSPMPLGYDVYNVPYAYRERYYDTPDALYRYSDGHVYQVDPETRLIAAAIELLAS